MTILSELQRRGVSVIADGDALVLKPRRAVDGELLARVRQYKPEIIRALSARRVTCGSPQCAGCYEVEPGVRIHPPKCSDDYRVWLERWEAKGNPQ